MITASLGAELWHVVCSIALGFANVAFTGSLLLSFAMMGSILWYAKRRPKGTPVSWGEAMAAAMYVTFILFFFFGVVPDRWLNYAQGSLSMRSDAILAGPGSTGWFKDIPVVISKGTIADLVTVLLYGLGFNLSVIMWAKWQKRGDAVTEEVEKSNYGRPLVKA
ncbi:hypothetical protein KSP35_17645 [Aquihabitans sp. G128]|uniref:hypothetical protein n=1 Tax=Aquihabitans sp. G128 TaxID=2849779 RepID=UPI001C21E273|nr:hypothetical protein [Aquihabitans sp. G128]QXC60162.1 hypothetical protein KSP35_17645 [Aquihabitans sp. G128]